MAQALRRQAGVSSDEEGDGHAAPQGKAYAKEQADLRTAFLEVLHIHSLDALPCILNFSYLSSKCRRPCIIVMWDRCIKMTHFLSFAPPSQSVFKCVAGHKEALVRRYEAVGATDLSMPIIEMAACDTSFSVAGSWRSG